MAGELRRASVAPYSRGQIVMLDRRRLETEVCEGYAVVTKENDRLLANAPAGSGPAPS